MDNDKQAALDTALENIKKSYGEEAIAQGRVTMKDIDAIPTGALTLDIALGIGGLPRGRIIEVYGPEGCGKTSLALHAVANAQQLGGVAAYIDAEHAVDPIYAENIGVDWNKLLFAQPSSGEEALNICRELVKSSAVSIVVIDSVAALASQEELSGELDDKRYAPQAQLMSKSLRIMKGDINKSNTCVIFINQIRMKMGTMGGFGNPENTPGGRALKFYSSVRLDIRRIGSVKEKKSDAVPVGNRTKVKVVKNKVSSPFKIAEYDIIFGRGINYEGCLIDLGEEHKLIKKRGSWYYYNDEQLGNGRLNTADFLKINQDIKDRLTNEIMENITKNDETKIQNK